MYSAFYCTHPRREKYSCRVSDWIDFTSDQGFFWGPDKNSSKRVDELRVTPGSCLTRFLRPERRARLSASETRVYASHRCLAAAAAAVSRSGDVVLWCWPTVRNQTWTHFLTVPRPKANCQRPLESKRWLLPSRPTPFNVLSKCTALKRKTLVLQ